MQGYVPSSELEKRIGNLQAELIRQNLDGALIVENTDLYYFSGTIPNGFLYVPKNGQPLLLVRKNMQRAQEESAISGIVPLNGMRELLATLHENGYQPKRIGMELDVLPTRDYLRYIQIFGSDTTITDISGVIRRIRSFKSGYEIQLLRESGAIHAQVFAKIPGLIREGMTDFALATRVEHEARMAGHLGLIRFRGLNQELFLGQVLAGPSAAAPTCYDTPLGGQGLSPIFPQGASGAVIGPNQPISIDMVGNYTGYMVDQTRMFCIGGLPDSLQKAFHVALEVQSMVEEEAKSGANGAYIYEKALQIVADAHLGEHFMGYGQPVTFIGHGVGLELNELPVIAKGIEVILEVGHVFALEPKFIFPGLGAVGIENTYVVTTKGIEKLTNSTDELQIL